MPKSARNTPRNDPRKPEKAPPPSDGPSGLEPARVRPGPPMTMDQGVKLAQTDDSLKAGPRGPTILEDFHLREKIMRFDHERIPERVVHARGTGAHGHFQVYESLSRWTRAAFLNDPGIKTPVFARFSTVAGSRGSADTARDVRGFAVKFYTAEGNFDLVGNNMPVFFIQDGIKFPDLIHAVKPEPRNERCERRLRARHARGAGSPTGAPARSQAPRSTTTSRSHCGGRSRARGPSRPLDARLSVSR